MDKVFTEIYETCQWGNNGASQYKGSSGAGSTIMYNLNSYIPFLQRIIKETNIESIVDLGCGDFVCGPLIYCPINNINYTGYDAYNGVIVNNKTNYASPKFNFIHLDFCNNKEEIISADLCILKDVIQHWSLVNIYSFMDYLVKSKKFKYILICNCTGQKKDNTDIKDGDWRPLSADYLPLKKYNPIKLYNYGTKEISVIKRLN
jgi:hypothetical protein